MSKTRKILRGLQRANPGLVLREPAAGGHWKLFLDGKLAGIIPGTLAREGLSPNLVSQLRRGGVKV